MKIGIVGRKTFPFIYFSIGLCGDSSVSRKQSCLGPRTIISYLLSEKYYSTVPYLPPLLYHGFGKTVYELPQTVC